jgi:two-component system, cell cycle sensor histidine kinase and response regulator CckA
MQKAEHVTRIISWLAGCMAGLVIFIFSLGYFVISYQYMAGSLEAEVEINSKILSQMISVNHEMRQLKQSKLKEYLAMQPKHGDPWAWRIFTVKNELVAETESVEQLQRPVVKRSRELFDGGAVVGKIELSRSIRPLIIRSWLLMLVMLPLGAGVFVVLRLVPLRALRRSEDALKKERDTAQQYLDVAGVMLVVVDAEQRVTLINRKGCEIIGLPEQKILHRNWFNDFIPDKSREEIRNAFQHLQDGKSSGSSMPEESAVRDAGGGERLIAWHHIVLTDGNGVFAGLLSSGEDITAQKQLETQLRQAQKMEAIGVLAGGIAHDFNNILTAIIGYASMLQFQMEKDNPLHYNVEQVLAASERAGRLVKSLLAYSRRQVVDPKIVNVNDIVNDVKKMLSSLLREDIELRVLTLKSSLTISADPGQIEQVLMNLASNARDAMPEGGRFSMETDSIELDDGFTIAHGYGMPGYYALITISDTGAGMSKQTQERIFDPFFTTKEVGKGTGLGLAMVYGIVKQHKGFVNVYSELGTGTTFKVYLPLVHAPITDVNTSVLHQPVGGTETILIAEDDEPVRKMTASVLRDAGYAIIEARDGEEAIKQFAESRKPVHLVILDVIMPKKNGKAAFDEIKKVNPDIKVVFMSGYTAEVLKTQMITGSDVHFVQKPASPRFLLKKVRDALDA